MRARNKMMENTLEEEFVTRLSAIEKKIEEAVSTSHHHKYSK
jgi:hypothetical protein